MYGALTLCSHVSARPSTGHGYVPNCALFYAKPFARYANTKILRPATFMSCKAIRLDKVAGSSRRTPPIADSLEDVFSLDGASCVRYHCSITMAAHTCITIRPQRSRHDWPLHGFQQGPSCLDPRILREKCRLMVDTVHRGQIRQQDDKKQPFSRQLLALPDTGIR